MKCPYCSGTIDVHIVKSMSAEDIQKMLDSIRSHSLTGDASEFYDSVVERLSKYGDKTRLTVPQRQWLKKLAHDYPVIVPAERKPDVL